MSLKTITELSNFYGADQRFVLAGGGNTSCKDNDHLYVKPSGVTLAKIKETDFVKMSREKIRNVFSLDETKFQAAEREAVVKKIMSDAVAFDSAGRPSVEAPLHESLPYKYVVHLHPCFVNGMTCSNNGASECAKLFPDALWVGYVDPGYTLAKYVAGELDKYAKAKGSAPKVVILQNHGVFVSADTEQEIRSIYSSMMDKLTAYYKEKGVSTELVHGDRDDMFAFETAPKLRSWLGNGSKAAVVSLPPMKVSEGPLSPDHVVYAKSYALITDSPSKEAIEKFKAEKGYLPLVVSVPGKAVFCAGKTFNDALTVADLAKDAALVAQLATAFGGGSFLSTKHREFIENWEVESYRKKVASGSAKGKLEGKIAVITGGAQGFGFGIAEELVKEGAVAAIADMNFSGAEIAADKLCSQYGKGKSFALQVNIADEASVEKMARDLVDICGGIDIFVANAGVLKAGPTKTFDKKDWSFVTDINYTGYFLCVKHISRVMSMQNAESGEWTDIVQINSKSGLAGSNRNAAYAGSKFGTIGLTQSFALELIDDKIKVNSICPGNFFDGPLWSDPAKGLFVQYLNSGKVPGAKTIEDVKKFYESKVPMNRGCFPADVAKAIVYAVEQKYETGQAIPVTGGQIMLN